MLLKDIKYKEYFTLSSRKEYDFALRNGNFKSLDLFGIGNFIDQTFGFVKDWQEILNYEGLNFEKLIKEMAIYLKKKESEIADNTIFDLHRCILYFKEEIIKINEIEKNALDHNPSQEEIDAGIDIFDKYHSFLQFDSLAKGNLLLFDELRKLPYSLCLSKLKLDSDISTFQTNLFKIRQSKITNH